MSGWNSYDPQQALYEHSLPPAVFWNRDYARERQRYILGEDGWWYDPSAVEANTALLSCAGDLMCEPRMTNAHRYGASYFFHPLFQYVRNIFRSSDFCVANLETTLTDGAAYAGDYHCVAGKYHYNGPQCYLDAVRYAGFDALVTANNHNCDSGIGGLWDTLRGIDSQGLMRTGSFLPGEQERVLFVKVCGFKIAILSYGNRYNGLDERNFTQKGIDECLNWFSKEQCLRDVAHARQKGAEFILCYQHWGKDYVMEPNEQQVTVLEQLKDCGVDYIVGSHTHCLQAHDTAVSSDGKQIPMMWSMGNFVTNERKELCKHTGILQLTLKRDNGAIRVEEHFVPCYVFNEFGTGRFCVVPADSTLNGGYAHPRLAEIREYVRGRLGDSIKLLPDRSMTLHGLCQVMGLSTDLPDRAVSRICLQSGDLTYGALYFAFGPLNKADKRRAIAMEVSAIVTAHPDPELPCIEVEDVAAAYKAAHSFIRPWGDTAKVILVTGKKNKTVTRELIARVLATDGRVFTPKDAEHITTAPWQDLHPSHRYCVLELREDHPLGAEAAALIRPDITVCTDDFTGESTALPCPGLPYKFLNTCTGAALEVGLSLGLSRERIAAAVAGYQFKSLTKAKLVCDGIAVFTDSNCTSLEEATALARELPTGKNYIVTTAELAPAFAGKGKLLVLGDEIPLVAAEEALRDTLKPGDTLVLCGPREADLLYLPRRLFGITDGFLYGGS